jgi:ATP-binding protein involved in chromosome partitioning
MTQGPKLTREEQKRLMEEGARRIEEAMGRIGNRVVVFSGKGGVGKTTVAVNLAFALAGMGLRVGLLDADITGPNVPQMVGVAGGLRADGESLVPHEKEGVKVVSLASIIEDGTPVIWRGPMRSKVIEQFLGETQWGELDYLIADLPPGTGDEVMTIAQRTSPQAAVVVTTPQEVALADVRRAVNMAKKIGIPRIGIVENMAGLVCPHCGGEIDLFGSGGGEREAQDMAVPFLGRVPVDVATRVAGDTGRPVMLEEPDSAVARAFSGIAATFASILAEAGAEPPRTRAS